MRELIRSGWLIVAAVLIPLLLFAVFQSGFAAREERRLVESRALAEARSVIASADAVVARSLGSLDALSTVAAMREGDVAGVHGRAQEIAALNDQWVSVALARARDGAILFDLRRPLGTPTRAAPDRRARVARRDTIARDGRGCPCVTIDRAVAGPDGGYVLTAFLAIDPFRRLLPTASRFPVSAIVSADGRFIARTPDHAQRVGTPGSVYLRNAVARGEPSGIYRGTTLEGFENYSAFARSTRTGWSAHLAMGKGYLDNPGRRFINRLGIAALLSLALAIALTWFALRQAAERRRVAERGQQAQKLEALGQLTGGIAHDFNNLLTPIIGALDFLLNRAALDDRARRIATGAMAAANRAGKLTAQLLAFSRRQKLQIVPVDVAAVFEEMTPILRQAVGNNHVVEVNVAPQKLCVKTDYNQLELAVLNLVFNARDALPGGGTIHVDAASDHVGDSDVVIIRVRDEGEGMAEDVRQRALEPFFTTKSDHRGTGLGLAQVFGLMQQSQGSVEIDSRVGTGTTVTLRLPECEEEAVTRMVSREAVTRAPARRRGLRLLLVDDDAAVRTAIARLFEEDGHDVDSVGDARVALAAIEHVAYDLAIVDFAMPVMDGATLIATSRALRPAQKFLMVTGYSDSEAVAAACPDTPVVRKPFDPDALVAQVMDLTA